LSALKQQHSFKQDQYPMTLEEAVQMLNAHDWDNHKINLNKSKKITMIRKIMIQIPLTKLK